MFDFSVDIVLPWVDGKDKAWRERYLKAIGEEISDERRYRDFKLLDMVLLGIQKNMEWVRKIFLITDNQEPSISLPDNVVIIDHTEIIPNYCIPTFNSNSIELSCYKIADLSENFLLFNDDIFVLKKMYKSDFFDKFGNPKDNGAMLCRSPLNKFEHTILNNLIVINKLVNKKEMLYQNWRKYCSGYYGRHFLKSILAIPWYGITGWHDFHLVIAYKKSSFTELLKLIPDEFDNQLRRKTRSYEDISPWIVRYWQLATGKFTPARVDRYGVMIELKDNMNMEDLLEDLSVNRIVCLNDEVLENQEGDRIQRLLKQMLMDHYEDE